MGIIDILDYADSYLRAAIKKHGGYPSSSKAKFLSTPNISEPVWYYPAKESINAHEIGRQSGSSPNYSSKEQTFKVPIKYPVSTSSTTKTLKGFKTDKTVSKNFNLKLGIDAKIPAISIPGFEIGFKPGASVGRDVKTNQTIDFSSTLEKTQATNDTPPPTTQELKCPPHKKATYTVVYFGGEPVVDATSVTNITGTGSGTGIDPTTGHERYQTKVLATLDYSKEFERGKKYTMMVTADQLIGSLAGYTPPPGVEANRSTNSLTIHCEHTVKLKEDFAYEIFVHFVDLSNAPFFNEELFIYQFDQDGNVLTEELIILSFEINPPVDIFYSHIENNSQS